ncbi:MAG: hypothetical protein ACK2T3_04305, partial [Candidatus Promineifilaceae bacterium]
MSSTDNPSLEYWVSDLVIDDADVEQIYNHFLEVEKPQTASQISEVIIKFRVDKERDRINNLLKGRALYQPRESFKVGEEIVFPALRFASGTVQSIREGYDPSYGRYNVLSVEIDSKEREFASDLPGEHKLNIENGDGYDPLENVDLDDIKARYGVPVTKVVLEALSKRDEFVRVGDRWFIRDLMADVNIGHLHLAEAVLDMNEGGPLPPREVIVHLDLDEGLEEDVRLFSLNWALLNDERFDEVGPPGHIAWFLRKAEPDAAHVVPERLRYEPIDFDRAQLSPQLALLVNELDDEWSDLEAPQSAQPTIFALTYPHRRAGTIPLSSRNRPLFPTGSSPRQRVTLVDEQSGEEIVAWVVREGRYVYGLNQWYSEHSIPVGGFITLKPGPEPGKVLIDFDRRRPKREWVRLATVEN